MHMPICIVLQNDTVHSKVLGLAAQWISVLYTQLLGADNNRAKGMSFSQSPLLMISSENGQGLLKSVNSLLSMGTT